MRRIVVIGFAVLFSATVALATQIGMSYEQRAEYSRVIVIGHVLAIDDIGKRPISGSIGNENLSLYPHSAARIIVQEVLKCTDAPELAVGDTVSAIFLTGNEGHPAKSTGKIMVTSVVCDLPMPKVRVGDAGAFVVTWYSGEWFLNDEVIDAQKMREAVRAFNEQAGSRDNPRTR